MSAVLGIEPKAEFQDRLESLVAKLTGGEGRSEEVAPALIDLCGLVSKDPVLAVRQMILWNGRADTGPQAMLPLSLVARCEISDKAIAEAIAPIFDSLYADGRSPIEVCKSLRKDPRTNSPYELTMMLAHRIEHPIKTGGRTVYDFSSYQPLLARSLPNGEENPGLFRHLFHLAPGQALEVVAEATGDQRLIQSLAVDRQTIDRYEEAKRSGAGDLEAAAREPARASLSAAAKDARWWVRLYAVEVMNQHSGMIDSERMRLLLRDPHPVVRGAVDRSALRQPID